MKRVIITPAALSPAALDELKDWLAITNPRDDAALVQLLRAALEMCEAFTGHMPLAAGCEEVLPGATCWQTLTTQPIQAIAGIDGVANDGSRSALDPATYAIDLAADGGGLVRLRQRGAADRIAVRFTAGMAAEWGDLPEGIRHGVVRLAAHHYRQRDLDAASQVPPAAVAAMWRPWRLLRLA